MIETIEPLRDEFYVGYEERMPGGIARRVAGAVVLFAGAAAIALGIWLGAQETLAPSRFEFGVVRPVTGVLRRDPYPSLEVDGRRVWLVGPGKFGAERVLAGTPDGPVTLSGSAIQRGRFRMLELPVQRPGSASQSGGAALNHDSEPQFRPATLTGEIVDSKCFLGVMNPGEGAVHRDCARRCLSGGIPPMLLVRDGHGREELVLLVSATGGPIGEELAPVAGRPITLTGRLARDAGTWTLYVGGRR